MAIGSAFNARGRTIMQAPAPLLVEGRDVYTTVRGEWFRCALFMPSGPKGTDDPTGRSRTVKEPTLMVGPRDSTGEPLRIDATMRVEVDSKAFGRKVYEIIEDPEPFVRRNTLIGMQMRVRYVSDEGVGE